MIINTGCRTDIPAYYSEWFYNRIKEGYVLTRNPYDPHRVTKYRLSPDVVDCIAFCTKNPGPIINRLNEIEKFRQFWFVTITPYGREIEPYVSDKDTVIRNFKYLSEKVGKQAVGWRYDPIFITSKYSVAYHITLFEQIAQSLNGYTNQCVISFIDLYAKTQRNFPMVKAVTKEERVKIGKAFARIGEKYDITIRSCCEGEDLREYGVNIEGCMTQSVVERVIGEKLDVPKKGQSSRKACNCLLGNDIGAYNTCGHGCIYCYANYNMTIVKQNMQNHNPKSPFLIGNQEKEDVICEAKQESYLNAQMTLF